LTGCFGFGIHSVVGELFIRRSSRWSLVASRSRSVVRHSSFANRRSSQSVDAGCCQRLTTNDQRPTTDLPHTQLIRGFQRRSAAAADDGRAIAACQRIADFLGADRAVERHGRFLGVWRCSRVDLHEHETVAQFSGAFAPTYSGGFRRIRSPSVGGSEKGNCQTLSFIQTPRIKSSRSFHGPIHLLLVAKKTQPWASGLPGVSITVLGSRLCVLRNSMNSAASFSYSLK